MIKGAGDFISASADDYEVKFCRDNKMGINIQRVDLSITSCHFHLSYMEKNIPGRFEKRATLAIQTPDTSTIFFPR